MDILNRWRQFGRYYFWPHLLFMEVAAEFGVPLLFNGIQEMLHQADSCVSISQLARIKDISYCSTYVVDYWHQHVIRTVIRHLSITWVPEAIASLHMQYKALLTTLCLLFNREVRQSMPGALPTLNGPYRFHRLPYRHPSGAAIGNINPACVLPPDHKDHNFPTNGFLAADNGRSRDEM